MPHPNHQIARGFFDALSKGSLPDELVTPDMTAWTTTSPTAPRERYQGGIQMLAAISNGGLSYAIDSLTAEDDRVVAEVQSSGTLSNGEAFHNAYVFVLHIRDGRIAHIAEHFNPDPVREKIVPLMQALMAKANS